MSIGKSKIDKIMSKINDIEFQLSRFIRNDFEHLKYKVLKINTNQKWIKWLLIVLFTYLVFKNL